MNTSIRHIIEKIKSSNAPVSSLRRIRPETYTHSLVVLIIILSSFASFGLGKLSALHNLKKPIIIENTDLSTFVNNTKSVSASISNNLSETASVVNISKSLGQVVASKTSDKYHLLTCPGAKTISDKNKILFSNPEEARKAGYLPAGNCKGLK